MDQRPTVADILFTEKDIIDAIDELSIKSATGPDNFPSILLKQCKFVLSSPRRLLWRLSMDSGVLPPMTKQANIISIHKGGNRGQLLVHYDKNVKGMENDENVDIIYLDFAKAFNNIMLPLRN